MLGHTGMPLQAVSGCGRGGGCRQRVNGGHWEKGGDTHSVTLGAWQAGSTAFSRHPLQPRGALVSGGTGSTGVTLGKKHSDGG